MAKQTFLIELTKAEKRALRILAALGEISMGEYVRREAIHEMWAEHFPDLPLGKSPSTHEKEQEDEKDGTDGK